MTKPGSITEALQALTKEHVAFVVAGGVAAQLYGSRRLTMDLDIIPSLKGKEWKKLLATLQKLGFEPVGPKWAEIENVSRLRKWAQPRDLISVRFRRPDPPLDIDVLFIEGTRYERYAANAQRAVDGSLELRIVSKQELVEMKQRAGRPTDLQDIEAMTRSS